MNWNLLSQSIPQDDKELSQILLQNRKVADPESYFNPKDPFDLSLEELGFDLDQVQTAKKRILEAIKKKQKILVFGDYDADGISATAVMWETLHHLGADALPFIPHREKHGYGLTPAAIEELGDKKFPDLIITVDTGITALDSVKDLVKKGVDVIITDHHQPEDELPAGLAVVHSTKIAGAAVSWVLAKELSEECAHKTLGLVALATVADMMPLDGINRSFVRFGLEKLNKSHRLGVKALIEVANLADKKIDAGHLGFVLGPRINAMGRLEHGMDALRLLCTRNKQRATELAETINETNFRRQKMTQELLQIARQQAREQKDQQIIIVSSQEFHEGVIGLIAGKLTQSYAKPAIVMSLRGEIAKASARSVPGVNVTELIRKAREHLIDVGGHPMAAGFGFEPANLEKIHEILVGEAELIDPALLQKSLDLDCVLPLKLAVIKIIETLEKFAPFGQKNSEPIFAFQDIRIKEARAIGKEGKHLRIVFEDKGDGAQVTALAWGRGEIAIDLREGMLVNVAGVMQRNDWNGRSTAQLILKDIQISEDF